MERFFVNEIITTLHTKVYSVQAESQSQAIDLIKTGHYSVLDSHTETNSEFKTIMSPIRNDKFVLRKEYQQS